MMRREFLLPEEDMDFLSKYSGEWETIVSSGHQWIIFNDYSVPKGYIVPKVRLALRIDRGYPSSQIDMAYFFPPLARADNKLIGALANQPLDGKVFQRWSRHRTLQNPWRPGLDNLETHLLLVEHWMNREFKIR